LDCEVVRLRTPSRVEASASRVESSHLRLRRVIADAEDGFRVLRFERMVPRSSLTSLGCDCSVGSEKADVNASRTGNGVRLLI